MVRYIDENDTEMTDIGQKTGISGRYIQQFRTDSLVRPHRTIATSVPHPRFPHVFFALSYGGNGITFSVIAAEILRDYFSGRTNHDAHLFRFGR